MSTNLPESSNGRPLAEVIAVATRSVHAKLNKLIIARLPLALPPRSTDPSVYISGLLHIAPIYITFEALWRNILDTPPAGAPEGSAEDGYDPAMAPLDSDDSPIPPDQGVKVHQPLVCDRIHSMLQHLYLPGLMRSDRLRADIRAMTGWPDHVVEEQLRSIGQTGRLGEFLQHVKRSVENRPHVLLAYSYILFMALFAGGRFIRASLESVGDDFWRQVPSPVKPHLHSCRRTEQGNPERASGLADEDVPKADYRSHANHTMPLRFFHFPTIMDGEDLKREFKRRLADSEDLLTAREKHDVTQEAVCIFDNMTLLIQQLDTVCGESDEEREEIEASLQNLGSLLKNPISYRLRDSVAVTKERRSRSSRLSSSSDDSTCTFVKNAQQAASSCPAGTNGSRFQLHQLVPTTSHEIEQCPALSKSMRFEKSLPRPAHSPNPSADGASDLSDSLEMASKRINSVRVTNLLVVVAFGAIILGALMTGRRGVMEV